MGNYMRRVFAIYMQHHQVKQSYRLLWQTVHDTPNVRPLEPDFISASALSRIRSAHAWWIVERSRPLPPDRVRLSPEVEYLLHQTYAPPALTVPSSTPDNWPAIIDHYQHILGAGEPILPP